MCLEADEDWGWWDMEAGDWCLCFLAKFLFRAVASFDDAAARPQLVRIIDLTLVSQRPGVCYQPGFL